MAESDVRFDRVNPSTDPELVCWAAELCIREVEGIEPTAAEVAQLTTAQVTGERAVYAVCDDGVPVAAAIAIHNVGDGRTELLVLATQPGRRGRGYGRAVIRGLAAAAYARGDSIIELCSSPDARGFYGHLGFYACGRGKSHLEAVATTLMETL